MSSAFESWLATPEMQAVFDAPAAVQAMLDFEAVLAGAQAQAGVISDAHANAISVACKVELHDVTAIVSAAARAGSLPIPLVKALTEKVAKFNADAAGSVHRGSTSQDVLDTALLLLMRRALALLDRDLGRLIDALLALSNAHCDVPMLGRTLLQPAAPIVFGIKAATWIAPLVRGRIRLRAAGVAALKLQLGGAVGTRAMLGPASDVIARAMADALRLRDVPAWHTQRDELAALGCEIGVLVGSAAKIARDWALLAQGEVGEIAEPSGGGRGGSSAMPHKRNPVAAMTALAAAQRVPPRVAALLGAMAQEHERGLGNWQAELAEWPGLFGAAHSALKALADTAPDLAVDERRMRANIDGMQGLVFAEGVAAHLASRVGNARAQALLEVLSRRAVDERRHLRDVLHDAAAGNETLRRGVDETLFDIDAATEPARRSARAQLDALREQAALLQASAPWSAFLPATASR